MDDPTTALQYSLDARYYVDADCFSRDLDLIFRRQWVCIGRAEEWAAPGSYRLHTLGQAQAIVVRDHDGTLRAHANVCRHRGSRLCTEPAGTLPRSIQCPYHAWTYRLDGTLTGAPHMQETPGFDPADFPLLPVHLAQWEGFVFLNYSPDPTPFNEVYAPLLGKFRRWRLDRLVNGGEQSYDVAANWKFIFENYNECYHCPLIHPDLAQRSPYRSGQNDLTAGIFLGGPSLLNEEFESLTSSGRAAAATIGTLGGDDLQQIYFYSLMPNMLLSLHHDYVLVHLLTPLAVDHTAVRCLWLFDPDAVSAPGFNPQDAVTFWDMTNRQDWHVCELSQAGVADPAYRPGPYSTLESIPAAFDRAYLQLLGQK